MHRDHHASGPLAHVGEEKNTVLLAMYPTAWHVGFPGEKPSLSAPSPRLDSSSSGAGSASQTPRHRDAMSQTYKLGHTPSQFDEPVLLYLSRQLEPGQSLSGP